MIILLMFLCSLVSVIFICPLWFMATNFKSLYSLIISVLIILILAIIAIIQVKKNGIKSTLSFLIRFLILASGISTSFLFVLHGKRLTALFSLFSAIIIFLLTSRFLKSGNRELAAEQK